MQAHDRAVTAVRDANKEINVALQNFANAAIAAGREMAGMLARWGMRQAQEQIRSARYTRAIMTGCGSGCSFPRCDGTCARESMRIAIRDFAKPGHRIIPILADALCYHRFGVRLDEVGASHREACKADVRVIFEAEWGGSPHQTAAEIPYLPNRKAKWVEPVVAKRTRRK